MSVTIFQPYNWETWKAEYKPKIRVMIHWEGLGNQKIETSMVPGWNHLPAVFFPGRKSKKTWMDSGDMEQWFPATPVGNGSGKLVIRCPAVRFAFGSYLLLDGCHRIRDLKPCALILDAICPKEKELKYFADLINVRKKKHGMG